jgi:hypothetical protein
MIKCRSSRRQPQQIGRLLEFGKAIDNAKSDFVPDLHLHHLGRETGAHALSVFQFELNLTSAPLDQMKQEQCRQPVQFLIGGVLTHVEDLRHAISLSFYGRVTSLSLNEGVLYNAPKEGASMPA